MNWYKLLHSLLCKWLWQRILAWLRVKCSIICTIRKYMGSHDGFASGLPQQLYSLAFKPFKYSSVTLFPSSFSKGSSYQAIYMTVNITLLQTQMTKKTTCERRPYIIVKEGTVQHKVMTTRKDKTGTIAIAKPEKSWECYALQSRVKTNVSPLEEVEEYPAFSHLIRAVVWDDSVNFHELNSDFKL